MKKNQRRKKLVNPSLQLKIVFMFLVISVLAVGIQSVLMSHSLTAFAEGDSERVFALLRENLLVTLAALLPATLIVGAITTFRIAGPLYRFERFLESIERGENPPDCVLRRGDDLKDFCATLNRVTRPLRTSEIAEATPRKEHDAESADSLLPDTSERVKTS